MILWIVETIYQMGLTYMKDTDFIVASCFVFAVSVYFTEIWKANVSVKISIWIVYYMDWCYFSQGNISLYRLEII